MADDPKRPRLDFNAFVLSLGSSALIHLGEAPDPVSGKTQEADLPLAQQSIDLLALLQEKTRGNLSEEEARFLDTLLYDLRAGDWDLELVVQAGLDAEKLPPIAPATHVIGPLRPQAAEALGLSTRCRVAVGTQPHQRPEVGHEAHQADRRRNRQVDRRLPDAP